MELYAISSKFKKISKPNFFHFVGIIGKQIINKLQDNKIDILDFLQHINK